MASYERKNRLKADLTKHIKELNFLMEDAIAHNTHWKLKLSTSRRHIYLDISEDHSEHDTRVAPCPITGEENCP